MGTIITTAAIIAVAKEVVKTLSTNTISDGVVKILKNTPEERVEKALQKALDKTALGNEFWKQEVLRQKDDVIEILIQDMFDNAYMDKNTLPNYLDKRTIDCFKECMKKDQEAWDYLQKQLHDYFLRAIKSDTQNTLDLVKKIAIKLDVFNSPSKADIILSLYECLNKKFKQKRESHPSFRLMDIDDNLFPNGMVTFETTARDSNNTLKTVSEIVDASWNKGGNHHLMIEGEGGIGKTVTLLSIPDKFAPLSVPAIYIPLHEIKGETNTIEMYIRSRILNHREDIYFQLLEIIDEPWKNRPNLLLLLDGFNEISCEFREDISEDIERWSEYPGIQIITSSRFDIHQYVVLGPNFSKIELQPLSEKTVLEYLKINMIGIPQNQTVRNLLNIPLLLTLYIKAETIRKDRPSRFANFLETKNAGLLIWNYLQCELWRFRNKKEDAKACVLAMEFIAPYIAWTMQQRSEFVLDESSFLDRIGEGYELLKEHIEANGELPDHIKTTMQQSEGLPKSDYICDLMKEHLCLFINNDGDYKLMHQQFRDVLAAMHLINSSYLSGDTLPREWNSTIDYYVMQFVADLINSIDNDASQKLWEQNRKFPVSEDATRNQLRLQGLLYNNDFSHLNFSGLDLRGISLYPFRFNNAILKFPLEADNLEEVKFSERSFSAEGHKDEVNCIAITIDGKRIVSGSKDNTIRVWDLETGAQIRSIEGHEDEVTAVTITQNGKYIISGSRDKTIRIWDLETGTQIGEPLKGHEDAVSTVAVNRDGTLIVSGSWDKTIRIWDFKTNKQLGKPIKEHRSVVSTVTVTPNGRLVVSGSWDNTIRIWDIETHKLIVGPIEGHGYSVNTLSVTQDGTCIVSGSNDKTIRIWDIKSGRQKGKPVIINPEEGLGSPVVALSVAPDGKRIVGVFGDKTIHVWDTNTRMEIGKSIKVNTSSVNSVAMTPDGKRFICGLSDKSIRIWDMETMTQIGKPLEGHNIIVNGIVVTSDGKRIISKFSDNTLRIWDLKSRSLIGKPLENYNNSLYTMVVTPDGNRIIRAYDKFINIYDFETGELIGKPLEGHEGEVFAVALTPPDGKRIVSRSWDNTIRIWDLDTQTQVGSPIECHNNSINAVAITPDGKCIISGSWDKTIRIWNLESGTLMCSLIEGHNYSVDAVTVTPDGKRIISGSLDAICIWDLKSRSLMKSFFDSANALSVTPDGKCVISRSVEYLNNTIKIWDLETGVIIKELFKKTGSLVEAITADGKQIIAGIKDGTIRITDIDTDEAKTIRILPLSVFGLDFSKANIAADLRVLLRQNGAKA